MQWYRIRMSRDEYASGELAILLGAFREVFVAKNGPRGMALFGIWSEDEEIYWIYVTPASVRYIRPLLDAYSAEVQTPLNPKILDLLSGDEAGRGMLIC